MIFCACPSARHEDNSCGVMNLVNQLEALKIIDIRLRQENHEISFDTRTVVQNITKILAAPPPPNVKRELECPKCHAMFEDDGKEHPNGIICPECPGALKGVIHPRLVPLWPCRLCWKSPYQLPERPTEMVQCSSLSSDCALAGTWMTEKAWQQLMAPT